MASEAALSSRSRRHAVQAGIQIEIATVGWMIVEAVIAISAGILARSVLLTAFGVDSVIELVTGGVLLWRLATEARGGSQEPVERAENRAAWITGIGLVLLCAYVVVTSLVGLATQTGPAESPVGIGLAVAAVIVMPLLAWRKRVIAGQINSAALRGDAACSLTCAFMAATLLVGLVANTLFGWWWADSLAALTLLIFLVPEAREALEGVRTGRGACACADEECDV